MLNWTKPRLAVIAGRSRNLRTRTENAPQLRKKDAISGYEFNSNIDSTNKYDQGPFNFNTVESSMYAYHIKISEELEKRNAKHQSLQRQHFMNTRYSQGRALTAAQLNSRFYTIPDADLDKLSPTHSRQPFKGDLRHTRRETFHNKNATKMFNATGEAKILRREQAEKIIRWIDNDTFEAPLKRVLLHGEKGVGKTMSLHQIAHHGMAKDMLVLYVGNLWRVATKNYATEPLNVRKDVTTQGYVSVEKRELWESRYDPLMQQGSHRPELKSVITYDQPEPAGIWLEHLKALNSHILQKYKTTRDFQLSIKETLPAGSTLLQAVNEALSRSIKRCDGIKFIIEEIKTLAPEMAKAGNPVLVCIDQANYLTQGCHVVVYDDPEKIRTHPEQRGLSHWSIRAKFDEVVTDSRRLNLMQHFKSLLDDDWCGGFVVGATTTYQTIMGNHSWKLGRHNDRSRIETEDLHDVLGDSGFQDSWHPFIPVKLDDLNQDELDAYSQYLYSKNIIYGRTENEMSQQLINKMAGANPDKFLTLCYEMA